MPQDPNEIRVVDQLDLAGPDGQRITLHEVRLSARFNGGVLQHLELMAQVPRDAWPAIDEAGLFQAPQELRGPTFAGGFTEQAPVELDLSLAPEWLTFVGVTSDDIWEVGVAVRFARTCPALHQTESWRLLRAKQQRGPHLKTGFETTWGGYEPAA